jgi:peroxiredoxin
MKPLSRKSIVAIWLFVAPVALLAPNRAGANTDGDEDAVSKDPVAAELNELGLEFQRLWADHLKAVPADGAELADQMLSDDEWLQQDRDLQAKYPSPDAAMMPRFFAFAQAHPDSPLALDALFVVIRRGGPQTGDVHGKPWQIKEEALDVVWQRHMDDPRIVLLLGQLGGSLPSKKTELFLRRALETSPHRAVQAAAAFNLAQYYHRLGKNHERSRKLRDKPQLQNFERYWHLVVTPYLEKNFPIDEETSSAEVERLLALVREKYADVPAEEWQHVGQGKVFLRPLPYPTPKTYGDLARSMQFELDSIVPGKQAPDIEGTDADGQRFRLSDYRGKVVLLTFSANWCGGCVKLYPLQRELLDKFRHEPFVILSVSRDEKIDTLKSSIASGDITWRCWWDGEDGPIRNAWNCHGIPRLILLDREHKFQDVAFSRFSTQADFENAIAALLQKSRAEGN